MTITFRATSNDVAPATEAMRHLKPRATEDVMQEHQSFHKAFQADKGAKKMGGVPRIIQSSPQPAEKVIPATHGFVNGLLMAYNYHLDLILRPDDVWQAILTQFSFYVNANAEELRDCFVDFQGKKELVVQCGGTLFTADFGAFANRMVDEQIKHNIKDASVADWLLPCFSTTTETDRIVASVSIMSTLQAFFSYTCMLMCGIPNVTLEGTPEDWVKLRQKLDRLPDYDLKDKRMTQWRGLLVKIVDEFVASAKGKVNLNFWDTICSHSGGGSGPSYLSGWVTAFCCFDSEGKWQGRMQSRSLFKTTWPTIESHDIPSGVISVPVKVVDNDTYETQMVAGQFGWELNKTCVRPRSDWCIAYNP